jgi:hypothetical protein
MMASAATNLFDAELVIDEIVGVRPDRIASVVVHRERKQGFSKTKNKLGTLGNEHRARSISPFKSIQALLAYCLNNIWAYLYTFPGRPDGA